MYFLYTAMPAYTIPEVKIPIVNIKTNNFIIFFPLISIIFSLYNISFNFSLLLCARVLICETFLSIISAVSLYESFSTFVKYITLLYSSGNSFIASKIFSFLSFEHIISSNSSFSSKSSSNLIVLLFFFI